MNAHEVTDMLIVGAGPAGLYASFYAHARGLSVRVVDSQSSAGGQLTAFYPDVPILDAPGFPTIKAAELATALFNQTSEHGCKFDWNQKVRSIMTAESGFSVQTSNSEFQSKTVILAAGVGAITPRTCDIPNAAFNPVYRVSDIHPASRNVVVLGGGQQAAQSAVTLANTTRRVTLIHSRLTPDLQSLPAHPNLQVLVGSILSISVSQDPCVVMRSVVGQEHAIPFDQILCHLGHDISLAPLSQLGVPLERSQILVDPHMSCKPGIYAIGDVCQYPGKLKLIANAFAEAAIAVNSAVVYLNPNARYFPGHSTSWTR